MTALPDQHVPFRHGPLCKADVGHDCHECGHSLCCDECCTNAVASTASSRDALIAGRLLALSESGDPAIVQSVVREAAVLAVTRGVGFAEGFVEGCWYVGGNRREPGQPYGLRETWVRCRLIFAS